MRFLTNSKTPGEIQRFFRRHWQRALRIREKVRFSEEAFHLVLAGGVGVIGGLVNLFFYYATESVKNLFLRQPGDPVEVAEAMTQSWQRVVTPMLGGLGAGLVLYWGLRLAGPQRSSNLLEVVVAGDGRLPFRSAIVKFISSLITIGSGGSIGREGGITQLAATLASKWGQLAKWHPYRLRLLVGCGAASGIAAAYNAPISGAVFAALNCTGQFLDELVCAAGFRVGGGDDGVAKLFRDKAVVHSAAVRFHQSHPIAMVPLSRHFDRRGRGGLSKIA